MIKFILLPIVGSFILAFFGLASLHKFATKALLAIGTIEFLVIAAIAFVVEQGYSAFWIFGILLCSIILMVAAIWAALFASVGPQEVIPAKILHESYTEMPVDQKEVVHAGLKFAAKVGGALLADHLKKNGYASASATLIQASKKL